jgi:hypothetical protein
LPRNSKLTPRHGHQNNVSQASVGVCGFPKNAFKPKPQAFIELDVLQTSAQCAKIEAMQTQDVEAVYEDQPGGFVGHAFTSKLRFSDHFLQGNLLDLGIDIVERDKPDGGAVDTVSDEPIYTSSVLPHFSKVIHNVIEDLRDEAVATRSIS